MQKRPKNGPNMPLIPVNSVSAPGPDPSGPETTATEHLCAIGATRKFQQEKKLFFAYLHFILYLYKMVCADIIGARVSYIKK